MGAIRSDHQETGNCSEISYVKEEQMPIGYRFLPTDEELTHFYLAGKVLHFPLPQQHLFQEIDADEMYSKHPKCLVLNDRHEESGGGEREWFVFINGDEYFGGILRNSKMVGNGIGFWRFIGKEEPIYSPRGRVFGFKIYLNFFTGCLPNAKKTHWRMELYRLHMYPHQEVENWILGRIIRGRDYSGSF